MRSTDDFSECKKTDKDNHDFQECKKINKVTLHKNLFSHAGKRF